jgi:hypothetical protein
VRRSTASGEEVVKLHKELYSRLDGRATRSDGSTEDSCVMNRPKAQRELEMGGDKWLFQSLG